MIETGKIADQGYGFETWSLGIAYRVGYNLKELRKASLTHLKSTKSVQNWGLGMCKQLLEWGERVQGTGRAQGAAARVALGPIPVSEDQSHWSTVIELQCELHKVAERMQNGEMAKDADATEGASRRDTCIDETKSASAGCDRGV
ncbi:hypothetical protein C8R44DRAFT_742362 [Mycena epipterygia]|nr:hypothetical protein C8R44DRAFT_742362 [Mycena epipterygia]